MIKLLNIIEENSNNNIICYHFSSDMNHMENNKFQISKANNNGLFGKAIYFTSSPYINSTGFHDTDEKYYCCKFAIKLQSPTLNMNSIVKNTTPYILQNEFNKLFKLKININFNELYDKIQYGEFFQAITDEYNWDYNKYYTKFINHLGFNSFKYYQDSYTDFISQKGDYGVAYGIYNSNDIKFLDGPF